MLRMWTAIQSRMSNEEGASLVEYALLVALIAVVAIVRCLSGLTFFHSRTEPVNRRTGSALDHPSTSIED